MLRIDSIHTSGVIGNAWVQYPFGRVKKNCRHIYAALDRIQKNCYTDYSDGIRTSKTVAPLNTFIEYALFGE